MGFEGWILRAENGRGKTLLPGGLVQAKERNVQMSGGLRLEDLGDEGDRE